MAANFVDHVSVARGNIVLADHGDTIAGEGLGEVPKGPSAKPPPANCDRCEPPDPLPLPVRFRPKLSARPLTFATANRSVSLFGFTAAAQDADDLDNKILPLDLQKQFEAAGVSFPNGAIVQGHAAAMVDQRRTRRVSR